MADLPGKIVGPAPPPPAPDAPSSIPPPSSNLPGKIVGAAPPPTGGTAAAPPTEGFHLFGTKPMDPVFGSTVAPAINMFDYPVRAGIGDALLLVPGLSTERQQKLKQAIIDATALPTTRVGKAVEDIAAFPGSMVAKGVGAASRKILGDKVTEALSPYARAAADVLPFGAGKFLSRAPKELPLKPSERFAEVGRRVKEAQDIKRKNRARRDISETYKRSTYEGGRNVQDIMDEMNRARHAGQPLLASDLSDALTRLRGTIYRQGGAAAARIKDFLEGRDREASARMDTKIDESLTDQSLRDAMKQQKEQRSANARPVWEAAMERGTSTAPFERQYELAWGESVKKRSEAQAKVAAADAAVTQARGRQATGGNVYADSAANQAAKTAAGKLDEAKRELADATKQGDDLRSLLQRAQQDGTLNAPGATWSIGLQRLLDAHPEIRRGINRGIQIMRLEASPEIRAGAGFNPRDYAIVGTDAAGEPIIGAVPTMRAWHAAKVGMDAFLRSPEAYDQFGGFNAIGRATAIARRELVEELDTLNKEYKPARDLWAGDTAVLRALNEGKTIFSEKHFMDDAHVREHFDSLGASEKQAFITGVRQELETRMQKLSATRDQSIPFAMPWVRNRLTAIMGPAADEFLAAVDREHTMKAGSNATLRGSQTAERRADDLARAEEQMKALQRFVEHLKGGHPVRAGTSLIGGAIDKAVQSRLGDPLRERARARQDIVNDIMARHLLDPNLALNPTGPLLSPVPGPPRTFPSPAMAYTLGTSITPEDRSQHR
jgi:hypothetical protein